MRKLTKPLTGIFLAAAVTAFPVIADEHDEERWFQVEILIFENPDIEADNPESWPSFADIQHPDSFMRIEGVSEILTDNSETDLPDDELDSTPQTATELDAPVSVDGLQAFVALSEIERQLNEQREKLEDTRGYRILFHEAWNQPVAGRDDYIPIRFDAGERFGRQSELQGYISLYVERYLHFATDLHLIEYEKSDNPFSVILSNDAPLGGLSGSSNSLQTMNGGLGGSTLLGNSLQSNSQITRKSDQYFVSTRSVQLKENRRMRSREVHYLDNPEFGLLILITPIEIQK